MQFSKVNLSSGEKVNKFEREFSNKFGFGHSVMVNSGSLANLVMIAALKKYFDVMAMKSLFVLVDLQQLSLLLFSVD